MSCPWFFIGTVVATGPECIINIYVIMGRRNLRWVQFDLLAIRDLFRWFGGSEFW